MKSTLAAVTFAMVLLAATFGLSNLTRVQAAAPSSQMAASIGVFGPQPTGYARHSSAIGVFGPQPTYKKAAIGVFGPQPTFRKKVAIGVFGPQPTWTGRGHAVANAIGVFGPQPTYHSIGVFGPQPTGL